MRSDPPPGSAPLTSLLPPSLPPSLPFSSALSPPAAVIAGISGFVWVISKWFYFVGYSKNVASRLWGAGAYLGLLTLFALTLASAVFFFQKKAPY